MSYTEKNYPPFDMEMWNNIKRMEFLRGKGWEVDFTELLKKMAEKEKYDKAWELIKKKNNW